MTATKRIRYAIGGVILIAALAQAGCALYGTGCSVIPTCAACTLQATQVLPWPNETWRLTASGTMGAFSCVYNTPRMRLNPGTSSQKDLSAPMPVSSSPYAAILSNSKRPSTATLCVLRPAPGGTSAIEDCTSFKVM